MKKGKLSEAVAEAVSEKESTTSDETIEDEEKGDERSLIYVGARIKTADELLAHAQIDLRIWEIERQTVNMWEVTGKQSRGQDKERRWRGDKLWASANLQIKVWLRRKAPKVVQDGILDLIRDWKPWSSASFSEPVASAENLLAMHLSDMHFGKRCWAPESGNNYDLPIAEKTFQKGFDDLLNKSLRYAGGVDEIWFPMGNDFFHVNDWQSRTVNETRVESTDDRFPKVFAAGTESIVNAVKRLSEIAPVKVIWVPGNHDFHTSWHLGFLLTYAFRDVTHVKVDMSLRARKYHRYGVTVCGFCHGEKVKENKLSQLMNSEARHLLDSSVKFREWLLGHLHLSRETEFRTEDSLPNLTIKRVPSLCGTDGWHDQMGFVDTYKMAEAHLYSKTDGPEARFITHA